MNLIYLQNILNIVQRNILNIVQRNILKIAQKVYGIFLQFKEKLPVIFNARETSPYVNRIKLMWQQMRQSF